MPTIIDEIRVEYPSTDDAHTLNLSLNASRVNAGTIASDTVLLEGEYHHQENQLPPKITQSRTTTTLTQESRTESIMSFRKKTPHFDLALGTAKPYALVLSGNAISGTFELGGAPITSLQADHGAGKVDYNFDHPNPQVIEQFSLDAGAAAMKITNLLNANFRQLSLNGGAGKYVLHFGGTLNHDAQVSISAGASKIDLILPERLAVKVQADTQLGSLRADERLIRQKGAYWTEATYAGDTPLLTIIASVSVGALSITLDSDL
jgi:hypothetical protein